MLRKKQKKRRKKRCNYKRKGGKASCMQTLYLYGDENRGQEYNEEEKARLARIQKGLVSELCALCCCVGLRSGNEEGESKLDGTGSRGPK
jgi:hypothetical protein